jgi:uncharacterized membrane protein
MVRLLTLWDKLRTNYWFLPALMALAAFVGAFAFVSFDRTIRFEVVRELGWVYTGGPEGARAVLSTIASSVIGVAGTTFSITIAVLSLASGQFGPRLLRGFMRDRGNQIVLGTFTSTFLYCLLVLRTVRGTDETTYVPHLSVTFGVFLAIVNVGVLIYFINHVAESIQVSRVIDLAGGEVDAAIDRLFPEDFGQPAPNAEPPSSTPEVVRACNSGYVVAIDESALLSVATQAQAVVRILARPGDHVVFDMPLVAVWFGAGKVEAGLRNAFTISRARTSLQDAEYALMQLAEVGVRALSPGTNDPFTAMACLDRLSVSMCRLAKRPTPPAFRHDKDGHLRIIAEPYPYERLVAAAFSHLRHASASQPAVRERLRVVLDLVLSRTEDPALANPLLREREATLPRSPSALPARSPAPGSR